MTRAEARLLVVPRADVDAIGGQPGVDADWPVYVRGLFGAGSCLLLDGSQAERDERYKQLVVYVLLEHEGRFACYSRCAPDGEPRLDGRGSIGFGGHIDSGDVGERPANIDEAQAEAMLLRVGEREVHEEVVIAGDYEPSWLGVVNDDRDAVGRVHLGFVHLWRLREPRVEPREAGICDLAFLTPEEIAVSGRPLESWTQLCLEHLRGLSSPTGE